MTEVKKKIVLGKRKTEDAVSEDKPREPVKPPVDVPIPEPQRAPDVFEYQHSDYTPPPDDGLDFLGRSKRQKKKQ